MDIIRLDEIMDLTKAPSDEGAVAKGDWGSEKVVNISCFVFRCQSMNKNNKSNYPQRTKRAKENTFSLLPPQAVPLPRLREAGCKPGVYQEVVCCGGYFNLTNFFSSSLPLKGMRG